jgi:pSer/pThr/pTyr-binding forkhead associated (FHA) protein
VITLTLLHPSKNIPVQNWLFEKESVITIGRSTENSVVLYSVVVSRHHVEILWNGSSWELKNLGANGTYINGEVVDRASLYDGMIIRLASSGPQLQIRITPEPPSGEESDKKQMSSILGEDFHGRPTIIKD